MLRPGRGFVSAGAREHGGDGGRGRAYARASSAAHRDRARVLDVGKCRAQTIATLLLRLGGPAARQPASRRRACDWSNASSPRTADERRVQRARSARRTSRRARCRRASAGTCSSASVPAEGVASRRAARPPPRPSLVERTRRRTSARATREWRSASPSTWNVASITVAVGAWRLRQPSRQAFGLPSQRRFVPVSRSSSPSAKLDLPDPLRPTTSVSPGPGSNGRRARSAHAAESRDRDLGQVDAGGHGEARRARPRGARAAPRRRAGRERLGALGRRQDEVDDLGPAPRPRAARSVPRRRSRPPRKHASAVGGTCPVALDRPREPAQVRQRATSSSASAAPASPAVICRFSSFSATCEPSFL